MTERETDKRIQDLEATVARIERMLANFPVRLAAGGGGDGLPEGGLKFQVLMKLDDQGTVGWEWVRWSE